MIFFWQLSFYCSEEAVIYWFPVIGTRFAERTHQISVSNTSATGKYVCLNLELEVIDEEDRHNLFEVLRQHPATKIIL